MATVILAKNWTRKGARLPKNIAIAKKKKAAKKVKYVRKAR